MSQTPPPRPNRKPRQASGLNSVQSTKSMSAQAAQFPGVGVTLRSYNYDSKDKNNRMGQSTVIKASRWQRFKRSITLKRTVLVFTVLVLIMIGWVGGKFIYNAHKLFGGNVFGILKTTKLKGEDTGRVNILLAGNSADDPGHDGANLTDSIMIISIDTVHNTAFMMSIPRDLYVQLPNGDGHQKINAAYVAGQSEHFSQPGYPSGGMGELEYVVSQDLGIPIDYYALVDYSALKDTVNALGGVSVNINSTDPRGLYDPSIDYATHGPLVKLTNGTHTLNGEQALDLARARGDAYGSYGFAASDFERTANQRLLIVAIKNKAETLGVLSNPAKLSNLFDAIGNNIKTDISISEVHRMYDLVKNINGGNLKSIGLNSANGKNLLMSYTTPNGQSALVPAAGVDDFSDIQTFINQITSSNPVVQEGAKVVVLNGTNVNGLATTYKTKLTEQNITVTSISDAGTTNQAKTLIIDNSNGKMPATKAELVKLFGNNVTTQNPYTGVYNGDFIVVLGSDKTTSASQ